MNTFTEKTYNIVRNIPRGETKTYKEVAILAGNPRAARTVANLMAKNYDKEIPCHRVVRSDGSLGGYNRGGIVEKKKKLQEEEVKLNKYV